MFDSDNLNKLENLATNIYYLESKFKDLLTLLATILSSGIPIKSDC